MRFCFRFFYKIAPVLHIASTQNISGIDTIIILGDLLHGPYKEEFIYIFNSLKEHYKNKIQIVLVYDEEMYHQLDDGKRSKAILNIRYSDFKLIKDKIRKELNYMPNKPLRKYKFGESIKKKLDQNFYKLNNF